MASAKQIAWRKKFARMSKAGKFKKKKTPAWYGMKGEGWLRQQSSKPKTKKSNPHNTKKPKTKNTQKLKKEMRY